MRRGRREGDKEERREGEGEGRGEGEGEGEKRGRGREGTLCLQLLLIRHYIIASVYKNIFELQYQGVWLLIGWRENVWEQAQVPRLGKRLNGCKSERRTTYILLLTKHALLQNVCTPVGKP